MKRQISATLSLFFYLCVAACGSGAPRPIAGEVYVVVPGEKAPLFTTYLSFLVKKYGMTPNLGQITDDKGYSVFVLDAKSSSVLLRSENVLLSGHEDLELCGAYTEPHSDPGQYFIAVSPSTQMADSRGARDLLIKLVNELKLSGYDVRTEPVICSPLSKIQSRG